MRRASSLSPDSARRRRPIITLRLDDAIAYGAQIGARVYVGADELSVGRHAVAKARRYASICGGNLAPATARAVYLSAVGAWRLYAPLAYAAANLDALNARLVARAQARLDVLNSRREGNAPCPARDSVPGAFHDYDAQGTCSFCQAMRD